MSHRRRVALAVSVGIALCLLPPGAGWCGEDQAAETVPLSNLTPSFTAVGWGEIERDVYRGTERIRLFGEAMEMGLNTHAPSMVVYDLDGRYKRFESAIGLWDCGNPGRHYGDEQAGEHGSVVFAVIADGKTIYDSGVLTWERCERVSLSVWGVQQLVLLTLDAGDGRDWDWSVWGNPVLIVDEVEPASPCVAYRLCCVDFAEEMATMPDYPQDSLDALRQSCESIRSLEGIPGAEESCRTALDAMRQGVAGMAAFPDFVTPDSCK